MEAHTDWSLHPIAYEKDKQKRRRIFQSLSESWLNTALVIFPRNGNKL